MDRVDVLNILADVITSMSGERLLRVVVDGIDASGKTTLADDLVQAIQAKGCRVIRASVDGFHNPQAIRRQRGSLSAEGYYYDAFDYAALKADLLQPLGVGGDSRYRTMSFDVQGDCPVEGVWQVADERSILIVDGVFLQRPELRAYWDLGIWVDVPFEVALERACRRDLAVFGSVEIVRERYAKRYIPGQQLYIEQCHPQSAADWIVENSDPLHPSLIGLHHEKLHSGA